MPSVSAKLIVCGFSLSFATTSTGVFEATVPPSATSLTVIAPVSESFATVAPSPSVTETVCGLPSSSSPTVTTVPSSTATAPSSSVTAEALPTLVGVVVSSPVSGSVVVVSGVTLNASLSVTWNTSSPLLTEVSLSANAPSIATVSPASVTSIVLTALSASPPASELSSAV